MDNELIEQQIIEVLTTKTFPCASKAIGAAIDAEPYQLRSALHRLRKGWAPSGENQLSGDG